MHPLSRRTTSARSNGIMHVQPDAVSPTPMSLVKSEHGPFLCLQQRMQCYQTLFQPLARVPSRYTARILFDPTR